eukprot:TRINITY_DN8108_c0_g1_i4.p1 TRINITY_DN8108_c0_g1~~TRINITY_DN8108_c0_g1_i4.p1  ORF type:complete len:159 (+),score=16.60 TRINITY_DN8108_c0_g1_i4:140-616(+)
MPNVCLEIDGAQVVLSTSSDNKHPPEAVIDGNDSTFWVTTGMYPQELIISFPATMRITSLETRSAAVKHMSVHKSSNTVPTGWEDLSSAGKHKELAPAQGAGSSLHWCTDLEPAEGHMQIEAHKIAPTMLRHLRIMIKKGHHPFCAVYSIKAEGMPIE